jgi:uncharacterized protein YaiE (UPF0345 family)
MTGTGTANTLNGESGLIFDGTTLDVNSGATNTVANFTSTDIGAYLNVTDQYQTGRLNSTGSTFKIEADPDNAYASTALTFTTDGSERMRIDSSGNVGIGVTPTHAFNLQTTGDAEIRFRSTDNNCRLQISSDTDEGQDSILEFLSGTSTRGSIIYDHNTTAASQSMIFKTGDNAVTAMKIDGSGNVGIGQASDGDKLHVLGTGYFEDARGNGVGVQINGGSSSEFAHIGVTSSNPLTFQTADTERMRIQGNGRVGIGDTAPAGQLEVRNTSNMPTGIFVHEANNLGSYNDIMSSSTWTSNSVNHQYFVCKSGNGSAISDIEFNLRGDGNAYADGSWSGGGADYAEYFEWADGNSSSQDRVGYSVSLVNNKIKIAESGETVIGVISGNPAVVGDNSWNSWKDKYQKDDYGRYIRNSDGHRISNPDYDDTLEYVKREDRKEWDIVGLMGKLRIKKGQQTGTNWIKMRDISDTVEEWLVR